LVVAEMQRFSNHFVGYIENERKGERIKKMHYPWFGESTIDGLSTNNLKKPNSFVTYFVVASLESNE